MSLLRFGTALGLATLVAGAGSLIACSSAEGDGDEGGTSEAAVVQERVVGVGRCRAPFVLDARDALPPEEQVTQRQFRGLTRNAVLSTADIFATVRTVRGRRQVVALEARVSRDLGFSRGTATLAVATTSAQATTLQTSNGQIDYQVRTLVAPNALNVGGLAFPGAPSVPLAVAVLHRETKSGRGWLLLGTREDDLAGVVSSCTFDERAWTLLADTACEGVLYDGADAGPSSCPGAPAKDGGVAADAGADAATKPSADAGTAADASTTGDAGAEADASAPATSAKTTTPDEEETPSPDEGAERTPTRSSAEEDEDLPTAKPKSASSGCSASPVRAGVSSVSGVGLGLALLLAARARRRAR